MVATRKAPIAPPTPSSRTNSSQPVPRVFTDKGSADAQRYSSFVDRDGMQYSSIGQPSGSKAGPNDLYTYAPDQSPKSKGKSKAKKAKKHRKARNTFVALVRDILFAVILIYSIFVCSPDKPCTPDSPVICRVLSASHKHLLEPYVITPLRPALKHPSISPYVVRVKPYQERFITVAEQIRMQTRKQWIRRVIPQWNKRVVPQWNARVVPYLHRVRQPFEPYRLQFEREYERRFAPSIRVAKYNVERWQHKAQPYVTLAANKAYGGYEAAKPYAIPAWQYFQVMVKHIIAVLRVQRVKFVDPHLITMWERITELSSGKASKMAAASQTITSAPSLTEIPSPSTSSDETLPSQAIQGQTAADTSSSSLSSSSSLALSELTTETALSEASGKADTTSPSPAASEAEAPVTDSTATASISPLSSVSESATQVVSSISSVAEEIATSAASVMESVTGPSVISSSASTTTSSANPDEDIDLDEFIQILGDMTADESEVSQPTIVAPPVYSESAEDREKRRLRTLEKREDITARHRQWEEDLEIFIKGKKKELRKSLVALRKKAAKELKESVEVRKEVESLVDEAEKFLKGAEAYLKTLQKEKSGTQEKEKTWQKVTDRVESKFRESIEKLADVLDGWYANHVNREINEVDNLSAIVRDFADRAQVDIAMDYAWLDDVTWQDWQRYHDLMRMSNNFTQHAYMIQNGSHPSPPINPVLPALDDLESEVKDIVTGFETRLRTLRRSGERTFAAGGRGDEESTDEQDADRGSAPQPSSPDVSILPIADSDSEKTASEGAIPPVVIGRGKQEVLDALGKLEPQGQAETTPGESPEEIVNDLAHVIDEEKAKASSATVGTSHVEL